MPGSKLIFFGKERYGKALVYVWLAVFFLFGLLTIKTYPPVNYNLGDEVWAWQNSLDVIDNGFPISLLAPRLYFFALGHFLSLAGDSLFAARSFSLLAATLALYLTYVLGRMMTDEWGGLLSSVLLGTTFAFTWHSRIARPETMTALFELAAFCSLYYAAKQGGGIYAFLGGLFATLSVNIHPNNLQFAIAFLLFYPLLFRKELVSYKTAYFIWGMSLGSLFWIVTAYIPVIMSRPDSGSLDILAGAVSTLPVKRESFLDIFWKTLFALPRDYLQYLKLFDHFFPNRIYIAVPAVAACAVWVAAMFTKMRRNVLILLSFVLLTSFISYFVAPKYGFWHMVEYYPFFAIAVAIGLFGIVDKIPTRARTAALCFASLLFLALGTVDTAATMYGMRGFSYERIAGKISTSVDGKTLAMPTYSPAIGEDEYVAPWFDIDKPYANCLPFSSKVRQLGVKYIIADDVFFAFSRKACGEHYEKDIMSYLRKQSTLKTVIPEQYPNYWAPGHMVRGIYIYRTPE